MAAGTLKPMVRVFISADPICTYPIKVFILTDLMLINIKFLIIIPKISLSLDRFFGF
jgi:hypothetical protein